MTLDPANKRALLLGSGALALAAIIVWALRDAGIPVPPNARAVSANCWRRAYSGV